MTPHYWKQKQKMEKQSIPANVLTFDLQCLHFPVNYLPFQCKVLKRKTFSLVKIVYCSQWNLVLISLFLVWMPHQWYLLGIDGSDFKLPTWFHNNFELSNLIKYDPLSFIDAPNIRYLLGIDGGDFEIHAVNGSKDVCGSLHHTLPCPFSAGQYL